VTSQLYWYTARSGGIVAWVLLNASVLWGLVLSTKVFGKRPRPNWVLDLHRFLGGAAVVFIAIHVASIVLDSYVNFSIVDIVVPFASRWHPVAVAWGIVAVYLLLAVEVTSLLRKRLSKKLWRATHYASFPLFVLATAHALSAGTDRTAFLMRIVAVLTTAAVVALTAVRVLRREQPADVGGVTSPRRDGVDGSRRPISDEQRSRRVEEHRDGALHTGQERSDGSRVSRSGVLELHPLDLPPGPFRDQRRAPDGWAELTGDDRHAADGRVPVEHRSRSRSI
jgi:hypothetical protein